MDNTINTASAMATSIAGEKLLATAAAAVTKGGIAGPDELKAAIADYKATLGEDKDDAFLESFTALASGKLTPIEVTTLLGDWSDSMAALESEKVSEESKRLADDYEHNQLHAMVNPDTLAALFLTQAQIRSVTEHMPMKDYLNKYGMKRIVGTPAFKTAPKEIKALQYLFYGTSPDMSTRMVAYAMVMRIDPDSPDLLDSIKASQATFHSTDDMVVALRGIGRTLVLYEDCDITITRASVVEFITEIKALDPRLFGSVTYLKTEHQSSADDVDISVIADAPEVRVGVEGALMNEHAMKRKYPGASLFERTLGDGTKVEVMVHSPQEQQEVVSRSHLLRVALENAGVSKLVYAVKKRLRNAGLKTRAMSGMSSYAIAIMTLWAGIEKKVLLRRADDISETGWLTVNGVATQDEKSVSRVIAKMLDRLCSDSPVFHLQRERPKDSGWSAAAKASTVRVHDILNPTILNAVILPDVSLAKAIVVFSHAIVCGAVSSCGEERYEFKAMMATDLEGTRGKSSKAGFIKGFSVIVKHANTSYHVALAENESGSGGYIVHVDTHKTAAKQRVARDVERAKWCKYKTVVRAPSMLVESHTPGVLSDILLARRKPMYRETVSAIYLHSCVSDCMMTHDEAEGLLPIDIEIIKAAAISEYTDLRGGVPSSDWIGDWAALSEERSFGAVDDFVRDREKAKLLSAETDIVLRLKDFGEDLGTSEDAAEEALFEAETKLMARGISLSGPAYERT